MKICAIIPARGGSKGVPRKNVRPLVGKPLVAHTVEAALGTKGIDKVVVSTEDSEIAGIAEDCGAQVVTRSEDLADDLAPLEPVMVQVLSYLEASEGYTADVVILLQPTSPLRQSRHLEEALQAFLEGQYDSLLSVGPSHAFLWKTRETGGYPLNYDYHSRPRRQDREEEFKENGAIYITRVDLLMRENNRLGGRIGLYVMPEETSWEIDSEFDFWLCERVLEYWGK